MSLTSRISNYFSTGASGAILVDADRSTDFDDEGATGSSIVGGIADRGKSCSAFAMAETQDTETKRPPYIHVSILLAVAPDANKYAHICE